MMKVNAGSRNCAYESGWNQWAAFEKIRAHGPFLPGGEGSHADEEELVSVMAY